MDEGDILSREEVEIRPRETAGELEDRLARVGAELLAAALDRIDRLPRIPQDHRLATPAPRLKKEQGRIDWTKSSAEIERMIRAFSPWPGAFTYWKGERLILHAGRATDDAASVRPARTGRRRRRKRDRRLLRGRDRLHHRALTEGKQKGPGKRPIFSAAQDSCPAMFWVRAGRAEATLPGYNRRG